MATSKAAAKPAQAEGGVKSKSKLLMIIGAAAVLLAASVGGAWYPKSATSSILLMGFLSLDGFRRRAA